MVERQASTIELVIFTVAMALFLLAALAGIVYLGLGRDDGPPVTSGATGQPCEAAPPHSSVHGTPCARRIRPG